MRRPTDEGMADITVDTPPVSRRKIIERPRLTRLLDESPARIKMLVAPAGYGKTTLARQWLESERPAAWIHCGPQSSDVAALADELAAGITKMTSAAGERLRERLMSTEHPAREVDVLAEMLVEDLAGWPPDAWLVVDNYQFIAESPAAELLFSGLISATGLNLLICGRRRPGWASARRVVYGEIQDIGRLELTMTTDEARELLGSPTPQRDAVLDLSRGWPAVLSLATLVDSEGWRTPPVPSTLYSFLADEIYSSLSPVAREGLTLLAVGGNLTVPLAQSLLGEGCLSVLNEGIASGMVDLARGTIEIHPMIREFLLTKFDNHEPSDLVAEAESVFSLLVAAERWDDAFLVVARFLPDRVDELMRAALPALLSKSRTQTLERWIAFALEQSAPRVSVNFAIAELAFRDGAFLDALSTANLLLSQVDLDDDADDLPARLFLLSGRSAHLAAREHEAMAAYGAAKLRARHPDIRRVAAWGEIGAAIDLELPDAEELLEQMAANLRDHQDVINLADKRLNLDARTGSLRSLEQARAVASSVVRVREPLMRCSFRSGLASTLALAAEYEDGLRVCNDLADDAESNRLDFVGSYALVIKAVCLAGLRKYTEALEVLAEAGRLARTSRDTHSQLNCEAVESRIHFANARFDRSLACLATATEGALPSMASEIEACRALAYAGLNRPDEALAAAGRARGLSSAIETRVLVAGVDAVVAVRGDPSNAPATVQFLLDEALDSKNLDCLACIYRGVPELFNYASPEVLLRAVTVVSRLGDVGLATIMAQLGGPTRGSVTLLSPREAEVGELVARGLTNKEIANALYISPATAKLHVHHIFEKLGVRTRTAAALKLAAGIDQAAPGSVRGSD